MRKIIFMQETETFVEHNFSFLFILMPKVLKEWNIKIRFAMHNRDK